MGGRSLLAASWNRLVNVALVFGKRLGGLLDRGVTQAVVVMMTQDFANDPTRGVWIPFVRKEVSYRTDCRAR